jgi:DNA-binding NtrC family response regulator
MKPIWIVDDDQSIRFVLEKALQREGLPTRSFTGPRDVLIKNAVFFISFRVRALMR